MTLRPRLCSKAAVVELSTPPLHRYRQSGSQAWEEGLEAPPWIVVFIVQPMRQPIVTLTTDFGLADHFVGAMKGVILGIRAFEPGSWTSRTRSRRSPSLKRPSVAAEGVHTGSRAERYTWWW